MVDYALIGYSSLEEYQGDFFRTLLRTTHSYDFFVDWKRVEANVRSHIIEWGLLNSLTLAADTESRRQLLTAILSQHPKVIECIPLLLAVRERSIEIAEMAQEVVYRSFSFDSPLSPQKIGEALTFFEKTGLVDLFGKIKDTYTYALGVEVGLDSNARKNRSGTFFSNLIETLLETVIKDLNNQGFRFDFGKERSIKAIAANVEKEKQVDFLINEGGKPVAACEVNIYHGGGSKPSEVARSYVTIGAALNKQRLHFIWFTDGCGWLTMKRAFNEASESIQLILNYSQATRFLKDLLPRLAKNGS